MKKLYISILLIIFIICIFFVKINIQNKSIKINVATAFYTEIHTNLKNIDNINLKYSSTQNCYNELINGMCDGAIVTMPSDEQLSNIEKNNIDLEFIPLFKEPLIFYLHKNNSIENLTIDNIQNIYIGEIKSWKELNGNLDEIITYQLEKNNGSHTSFEKLLNGRNVTINNNHFEVKYMDEIIRCVNNDENGIAYAFNSYYRTFNKKNNLKKIAINNIKPVEENFIKNDYELMYDVFFVYNKNLFNEKTNEFLEYIVNIYKKNEVNKDEV